VADALAAAGGGFNLTTAATGTGVANGTSVSAVGAGETATVTAGNNIITTQVGNEVQVAVNPVLAGLTSVSVTGGPTLSATGIDMGGDRITNLGAGSTAPGSTDAVNGGQLNTGLTSVANNFGGTSVYNPVTGAVTAPVYNIQGNTYNNVGDTFDAVDTNLTNILNGTSGLVQQVGGAPGTGQITVGAATGGTSVSFAGTGGNRILTDLAPGAITAASDDAVNGSQIFANNQQISNLLGGGAGVDPATGALTAPTINVGGNTYNNVTAAIEAEADRTDEGLTDVADALGGGAVYDPNTGAITGPTYNLGGNTYTNVGSALSALANGGIGPVQYANAATPTTPNGGTPTNNLTLVGATTGPVTLDNVAAASLTPISLQAVNGSQLNAGLTSVASGLGGGSAFDPATGTVTNPTYNVQGGTQTNVGDAFGAINTAVNNINNGTSGLVQQTGGAPGSGPITVGAATGGTVVNVAGTDGNRTVTGVAAGALTATSVDAVNGGQVNTALGSVASALGGGSTFDPVTGAVTNPTYNVAGGSQTTVGGALTALDNSIGATNTAVNNLANGTTGLVRQVGGAPGSGDITVAAETGGTTVNVAGTAGDRRVTGVSAGAVNATSTDAVNGSQLAALGSRADNLGSTTAAALGGGSTYNPATGAVSAPNYTVGGRSYNNTGAALAAGNALAVQYVPDSNGAPTNAVRLGTSAGAPPVSVTNVAAGAVTATSTDAVNGGQLFTVQQTANGALQRSGGTLSGNLGLGGNRITGLGAPVEASDAATRGYVDGLQTQNVNNFNLLTDGLNKAFSSIEKASQGTALAIAMGGGFLSDDKDFSLWGAWGNYNGYNAAALQTYIRLSDDAYINAGLSYGFEEQLVGTRVGFGIQF
jgi:trimeric autotransporter adhesin